MLKHTVDNVGKKQRVAYQGSKFTNVYCTCYLLEYELGSQESEG